MEKKRRRLTISELDVQPISDEELASIAGSLRSGEDSYCDCIIYRSDYDPCNPTTPIET